MADRADDLEGLDLTSDLTDDTVTPADGAGGEVTHEGGDDVIREDHLQAKPGTQDLSLRDQLSNAFKASKEGEGGSNSAPDASKGAKPGDSSPSGTDEKAPPAAPSLTQDAEGRWRKADGTFASTEEVAAMQAGNTEESTQSYEQLFATLPADVATEVKSLPAKTQAFLGRTMEDLNNRGQRYAEYDQLESIIGPRREAWQQNGMNPLVAINQLFALSDYAGQNPAEFVLWFADQNNIDLDAELDKRDAQQRGDPEVQQLRGQVQQLSSTLSQLQQGAQPNVQQNPHLQAVQAFVSETDEGGNPKRPYLNEVMPAFAAQVSAVRAANPTMQPNDVLARAYEAACWADPNVRAKMQAEVDQQRREEARQKVAQKRNASSSVRGAPNGGGGVAPGAQNNGNMTLRETLEAAFREHGG